MTVLLAVRGETFVVLGADRLTTVSETENATGRVLRTFHFETTKIVIAQNPAFALSTAGWAILAGMPSSEYAANCVMQQLAHNPVGAIDWLVVARVLQTELRASVSLNNAAGKQSLTVQIGVLSGAAPTLIQLLPDTEPDVTAAQVSTNSVVALAPSNNSTASGPYWAHQLEIGFIPDWGNRDMVVADVRRLLEGAIAEEKQRMGKAAEVGGIPDIAVVDQAGARLL